MWQRLLTLLAATKRPLVFVDFETAGLGAIADGTAAAEARGIARSTEVRPSLLPTSVRMRVATRPDATTATHAPHRHRRALVSGARAATSSTAWTSMAPAFRRRFATVNCRGVTTTTTADRQWFGSSRILWSYKPRLSRAAWCMATVAVR